MTRQQACYKQRNKAVIRKIIALSEKKKSDILLSGEVINTLENYVFFGYITVLHMLLFGKVKCVR